MRTNLPAKSTSSPSSTRSAQPVMDPYGIYGTRSANRMRAAKKRRKVQGVLWLFTLCGLMAAIVTAARVQRVASTGSDWDVNLMARPAGFPVWAHVNNNVHGSGVLLMPTESGQLLSGAASAETELRPILQTDFPLRAEPLVLDGTAYVPCEDGALYAISLSNNRSLWRYQSDAAMTTRPAYLEYSVSVPNVSIAVRAVSPAGTPAKPEPSPTPTPVAASVEPDEANTRQQVRKSIICANDQGLVTALDASNGHVRWRRRVPAPVGDGLVATELAGRSLVLAPLLSGVASRGGLWCMDGRTGAVVWKFPNESKTMAAQLPPPVVEVEEGSGRVYSANDSGAIFCLDLKSGSKIGWQKAYVSPVDEHKAAILLRTEPILEQYRWGTRLIVAGSDGGVHCFDVNTGKIEWSFEAPAAVSCRLLSLKPEAGGAERGTVQNPVVLVGCDGPGIYVLDARTGALVRKLRTRGAATTALINIEGSVLAISSDGLMQKYTIDY